MHKYSVFGLCVASDLELPELPPGQGPHQASVTLRRLGTPPEGASHNAWIDATGALGLHWDGVGTFRVHAGREIAVDPEQDASPERVRLFLLGAAFGMLLQQRGLLVLHASAIAVPAGAVAFLGFKGAGKSTIAAALASHGYTVIADDVLAVDLRAATASVSAGPMQLKLWPDSLAALGHDADSYGRVHPLFEKRDYRTEPVERESWPLKAAFVLGYGKSLAVTALASQEALMRVLANWYGFRFERGVLMSIGQPSVLGQAAEFLKKVPVYLLERPVDMRTLSATAELVAAHTAE